MHNKEHSAYGTMHMKNILHLVLCTWRTNTHCTYSVVWKADLLLAILPFFWSPSASLMRRARGEVHVFRCQIESYDLWSFFSKSMCSWFHMHLFHCLHSTKDFPDMFLIHGQVQFRISQGLKRNVLYVHVWENSYSSWVHLVLYFTRTQREVFMMGWVPFLEISRSLFFFYSSIQKVL